MAATIATFQEVLTALGIRADSTEEERALAMLAWPSAESAVKNHIGFLPTYGTHVEYYPLCECDGDSWDDLAEPEVWETNTSLTKAVTFGDGGRMSRRIILRHTPVRSITEVKEDPTAHFGQQAGDFAAGTVLVAGEDYFLSLDKDGLSRDGILYRDGGWTQEPGTIKVTYVGGYSVSELMGLSGEVDAAALKQAVLLMVVLFFNQLAAFQRKRAGFVGGLKSERLGDYAYTLSGESEKLLAGMGDALPDAVLRLLEPYERILC